MLAYLTIGAWLRQATKNLESSGIDTARLDALVLLEDTIGKNRANLLAHPDTEINHNQLAKLNSYIKRRSTHIPLAFVRGRTEFYGREFYIDNRVLEPRPESETMIEILLSLDLTSVSALVDVGTGSGALGITAKLELPGSRVDLLDIDKAALSVAKKNVNRFGLRLKCVESDLLGKAIVSYDVILANLPYVPDEYTVNQAALMEPRIAIFGGRDGLDLYRRLFKQLKSLPTKPNYILTESLPFQHKELTVIANSAGYSLQCSDDFIQCFKSVN